MSKLKLTLAALVAPLVVGISPDAIAEFPEKPIKLVIPFRAGGGSDALARTIQAAIEKHRLMAQKLIVTNIDGAGGSVGARQVKDAKPDGYTFLQVHNGMLALAATGRLGFDPTTELTPVAQTTRSCLYLAVPTAGGITTFEALVAKAKANPNKLKAADTIGGVSHFPWVQLMNATGIKVGIVQTGGTSKRFASMKGGHTQAAFMSPGWNKRGGADLKGVLWLGPTRHSAAPDIPTAKEKGFNVTACLNRRFWAPKGTPRDRVAYFAGVLGKVMATDELKAYHKKRLGSIRLRTGVDVVNDVKAEYVGPQKVAPEVKAAMGKK